MPAATALTPRETPLSPGDAAPDFTLLDQDSNKWTLSERLGDAGVVLCFYPMDFSPVCSTEMRCVSDELGRFAEGGAEVVGVSCDSFFVHKAWAQSLGLTQTLLADMKREVCRAYGLYFPDLNVASRGTVFVRPDGTVGWVQARELGAAMDLDEVIAAIS